MILVPLVPSYRLGHTWCNSMTMVLLYRSFLVLGIDTPEICLRQILEEGLS